MDLGEIVALFILVFVYLSIGFTCTEVWKGAIEDIETRVIRVSVRLCMALLWPAWIALWIVCVAIGMLIMGIIEICK